jgi:hypothetical protein
MQRQRLVQAIDRQVGYAKAMMAGTERSALKSDDGRRVACWFYQGTKGTWLTQIRIGSKAIDHGKGTVLDGGPSLEDLVGLFGR